MGAELVLGLVESLRWEVEPFGVKTLLVEPGRFRTNFLSDGHVQKLQTKNPDYERSAAEFQRNISREDMAQPGDATKACELKAEVSS
jgi:short-subunit dehydrogenase